MWQGKKSRDLYNLGGKATIRLCGFRLVVLVRVLVVEIIELRDKNSMTTI